LFYWFYTQFSPAILETPRHREGFMLIILISSALWSKRGVGEKKKSAIVFYPYASAFWAQR